MGNKTQREGRAGSLLRIVAQNDWPKVDQQSTRKRKRRKGNILAIMIKKTRNKDGL